MWHCDGRGIHKFLMGTRSNKEERKAERYMEMAGSKENENIWNGIMD